MGTSRSAVTPESSSLDDGLWCRAAKVLSRQTPTQLLLLPAREGEPVCLTGPGRYVWELLREPTAIPEVVAVLSEAYGVEADQVRADLDRLLHELVRRRLITRPA
jgi:hypothetical protein